MGGELLLLVMRMLVIALLIALVIALIVAVNREMRANLEQRADLKKMEHGLPAFYKMIYLSGAKPKNVLNITLNKEIIVGRNEISANVIIDSNFVSTKHTRLFNFGDSVMIEDLGSTNGTYVNGEMITAPKKLSEDDIVIIGDTEFKVV